MSRAEELLRRVESYSDQMVEALARLTAVPALGPSNGGQGEMAKAELILPWLRDMGLEVQRADAPDPRVACGARPNLLASLAGGPGPAVWVLAHLDVVPVGDPALWSSDPWTLKVEGGRLVGRGTEDNHHGLVSALFGLKAVKELGLPLPGPAGLALVSDEETGSQYGLDHLLKARPGLFTSRDIIVVPDAGRPDGGLIEVAEKSIYWLRVEVTGKQVHGSTPHKGVNALYAAARMMVEARAVAQEFGQDNPLFRPPRSTCEPTAKEKGVDNINTIPGRDVFCLDCRVLPGIPLDEVRAEIERRFGAIAAEEGAGVAISEVQRLQAPPATPSEAPVVKALERAIARVHGLEPHAGGIGGGTVAAFFRQRGLPVAVWSSCQGTAHMPNEWTSLEAMVKDAQVFALLYAGL
ncbi:MAG: M20 family metallo-hydrolase [Desulfarculus sp.]|nr:M20 family metallo-hydrolase [Desulfarculus sp.]